MKCSTCKGSGKITLTIDNRFNDEPDEVMEIDCIDCDGTGEIDKETAKSLEREKNMWCKCGNPSEDVDFYDDGEHSEIHKHHYRCRDCGGIVQIG